MYVYSDISSCPLALYLQSFSVVDLASSVWTIIEENVAIICACLPMMWVPLARFFPSFSKGKRADSRESLAVRSSGNNTASRSRNSWVPLHGSSDDLDDHNMDDIGHSQNRPLENTTGQIHLSSRSGETYEQDVKGIRKVTEYQVSYSNKKSPSG